MTRKKQDAIAAPAKRRRKAVGYLFHHTYSQVGKDGKRRTYKSKRWYLEFRTPDGKRVRRPAYTDKAASEKLLMDLETEAARVHAGMLPSGVALTRIPLETHLAEYVDYLKGKGVTPRHAREVQCNCSGILKACGFSKWNDLNVAKVASHLADRRRDGLAISSSNSLHRKFRAFVAWLARKVQAFDPLIELKPLNAATDPRRVRRSLTAEEFARLVLTTQGGGESWGLSGSDRGMLYATAGYTGLRASELASLTPASFDLGAGIPTVTVQAAHSKHRRLDVLPLPDVLVERLRGWLADRKGLLWPGRWAAERKAATMLRGDLEAAWIPYADENGHVVDFHSLRNFYITSLLRAGVHAAEAQKLARHSDPRLTLNVYAKLQMHDLAGAVNKLTPGSSGPWGTTGGKGGGKRRNKAG